MSRLKAKTRDAELHHEEEMLALQDRLRDSEHALGLSLDEVREHPEPRTRMRPNYDS